MAWKAVLLDLAVDAMAGDFMMVLVLKLDD